MLQKLISKSKITLLKFIRWTRQIRIWLGGNKEREERFKLFQLSPPLQDLEFRKRLIPMGYQYNLFSHAYRGQIWTLRRLDPDGKHQFHLRYYRDGWITGHWELDWMVSQDGHMKGIDLRALTEEEIEELRMVLIP